MKKIIFLGISPITLIDVNPQSFKKDRVVPNINM
jgi:hypothetical protein